MLQLLLQGFLKPPRGRIELLPVSLTEALDQAGLVEKLDEAVGPGFGHLRSTITKCRSTIDRSDRDYLISATFPIIFHAEISDYETLFQFAVRD